VRPSRRSAAPVECQRDPSCHEEQSSQGSDGAQEPELRAVEGEGVDAAAEEGHASGEERRGQGVIARDEQGDGVNELSPVRIRHGGSFQNSPDTVQR